MMMIKYKRTIPILEVGDIVFFDDDTIYQVVCYNREDGKTIYRFTRINNAVHDYREMQYGYSSLESLTEAWEDEIEKIIQIDFMEIIRAKYQD